MFLIYFTASKMRAWKPLAKPVPGAGLGNRMANKADKLRSLIGLCSSEGAWLIDAKGMNRTAYRAIVDT